MEIRPLQWLSAYSQKYPNAWNQIASFRAMKGTPALGGHDWPNWCYVPLAGAMAVASGGRTPTQGAAMETGRIGALAAWRLGKGVYRFDPTVFEAVWETPLDGTLPTDLLFRLPEWCVYVEIPKRRVLGFESYGFFAHLEHDVNHGHAELRFLLDTGDGEHRELHPMPLHLSHASLRENVNDMIAMAQKNMIPTGMDAAQIGQFTRIAPNLEKELVPLISLVLYLCSATVETRDAAGSARQPSLPEATKIKGQTRIMAAPGPTIWETGYRMGAALRGAMAAQEESKATDGDERETPDARRKAAPHIRRAHWHTFWAGPRDAEQREKRLKWLPPIPVNLYLDEDGAPAVIHPVQ